MRLFTLCAAFKVLLPVKQECIAFNRAYQLEVVDKDDMIMLARIHAEPALLRRFKSESCDCSTDHRLSLLGQERLLAT